MKEDAKEQYGTGRPKRKIKERLKMICFKRENT